MSALGRKLPPANGRNGWKAATTLMAALAATQSFAIGCGHRFGDDRVRWRTCPKKRAPLASLAVFGPASDRLLPLSHLRAELATDRPLSPPKPEHVPGPEFRGLVRRESSGLLRC